MATGGGCPYRVQFTTHHRGVVAPAPNPHSGRLCFSSSQGLPRSHCPPHRPNPTGSPQASEDGSDDFSEIATHSRAWDRVGPSSPPGVGSMPSWGRRAESQSLMRTTAAVPSQGVRPQLCPAMHKASSYAEIHPRPRLGQDVHFNPILSQWDNPRGLLGKPANAGIPLQTPYDGTRHTATAWRKPLSFLGSVPSVETSF